MNYMILNNGVKIPQLGIGGFGQDTNSILEALRIGYRLIDTAAQYENEEEVGQAVRRSGIPREEIFLSTKLWTEDIRRKKPREAFFESLRRLAVEFVDLFLINWPAEGFVDAWYEMEKLYEEGYIRAIGVSNFHETHLKQLEKAASVMPAVNQIESHPKFNNQELVEFCRAKQIQAQAWCPLGGSYSNVLQEPKIVRLAEKHGRSPAQIVIRWHMQRGVITFPKSSSIERMASNFDVWSFALSADEMLGLDSLDTGHRIGADPENFDF